MTHKPLIIANWKSHKLPADAVAWMAEVQQSPAGIECVVAPSHLLIGQVTELPTGWTLGAQDVSPFPLGSYTGAVPAAQLAALQVRYCIVGHSERRKLFGESNQDVAKKCTELLANHITPVICVDRPYLQQQLSLLSLSSIASKDVVFAYEPVEAIGSGKPADVGEVTAVVSLIKSDWPESRVLYGGSIDPENFGSFLLVADGGLIGSASLNPQTMNQLVAVAKKSSVTR